MKRQITWVTVFMLVSSLLAGCGNTATEPSDPESLTTTSTNILEESVTDAPLPSPSADIASESAMEEVPNTVEASIVEETGSTEEPTEKFAPETLFQDYWDEPDVSEMYATVADKFELREYYDEESGLTIPYNFYIPKQAAKAEALPMVMFIGDATTVGTDTQRPLYQGYGGIIWAIESEQEKHPSYVLVPVYDETVIDDNSGAYISDYVEATARMVETVAKENNVDTDRIYTTGQSMGCMTSLYLAANHPDLFAAELFVSGQWDVSELQGLENQTFFYVAAGGDPKASAGQSNLMADFDSKGVDYSVSYDWDANLSDADMESTLRGIIGQETDRNFGQFAPGTVLTANPRGIEHMSSFDCVYKLDVLRNWLFAQSK